MAKYRIFPFIALCPFLFCWIFSAQAAIEYGLAQKYPYDKGISNDPDVVFIESFEQATISQMQARWESIKNPGNQSFTSDVPALSSGKQSLFMSSVSDLYTRILPGYEQAYLRFYAKFGTQCTRVHHWVWLGGQNPSLSYPNPRAGLQPVGDDRWSSGIEPLMTSWGWDFYTYWRRMRRDRDGNFWGNFFNRDPSSTGYSSPYKVVKGEWICIELMVKMNNPASSYNGEQAFWINGEKKSHLGLGFPNGIWDYGGFAPVSTGAPFEGFSWRITTALNINYIWLEHYVDSDGSCTAWFDDVVIAKSYIGPIVDSSGGSIKTSAPSSRKPSALNLAARTFSPGETGFDVDLGQAGGFDLQVLDLAGRGVWSYHRENAQAGRHQVVLKQDRGNAEQPEGLCFVVLTQGNDRLGRRLLILR